MAKWSGNVREYRYGVFNRILNNYYIVGRERVELFIGLFFSQDFSAFEEAVENGDLKGFLKIWKYYAAFIYFNIYIVFIITAIELSAFIYI